MEVEDIIGGLTDGISAEALAEVTALVLGWVDSPVTPPLPLLLSLRQTLVLIKKSLVLTPESLEVRPQGPQPPSKKRGRRTKLADPEEDGDEAGKQFYESTVGFVRAFAKATKLGMFNDVGNMDMIVGIIVQSLTLECGNLEAKSSPDTGKPTPLTKACFECFRSMLLLPGPVAHLSSDESPNPSSEDGGFGSASARPQYPSIVLPALIPLLSLAYGTTTPYLLKLRTYTVDFLTKHFHENQNQHDALSKLLVQLCITVTSKVRTENRRLLCDAFVGLFACFQNDDVGQQKSKQSVDFILNLCLAQCNRHRLFATEVSAALLARAFAAKTALHLPEESIFELFEVLLLRSNDSYPVARRFALQSLAELMDHLSVNEQFKDIFGRFLHQPAVAHLPGLGAQREGQETHVPNHRELLLTTVTCRLKEDKAWVRKSSIRVMRMIVDAECIPVNVDEVFANIIEMSQLHCEESVLVRKEALSCLVSACRGQLHKYKNGTTTDSTTLANDMDMPTRIITNALLQAFARDNEDTVKALTSGAVAELLFAPLENSNDKRSISPATNSSPNLAASTYPLRRTVLHAW